MILRNLGCSVDVTASGREAMQMVETFFYHIVFMDCEMPEMDGFEATAAIRRRPDRKSKLPIVAVTAQAMQGDKERCLLAGMDDYISKPVRQEDFAAALTRWVPTSKKLQHKGEAKENITRSDEKTGNANAPDYPSFPVSTSLPGISSALNPVVIARLRALAEATEPSLIGQIFTSFLSDGAERIDKLQNALDGSDLELLRKTAHALRGASANIGAHHLVDIAQQLELLGKASSMSGAAVLIEQIEGEFERVKSEIAESGINCLASSDKDQS
jgi:two-component system, sensor histidine kinase and response regulator